MRSVMRSRSLAMPRNMPDLPIRLRPWFLVFTSLIMVLLALLGFTNIPDKWPVDDKILHFVCFGGATGVFYFIFDVDEDARRIWFWRYFGMTATAVICFFFGGLVSEIVQSLLPYKAFQYGDVLANLLGSGLGLYISYHLERYYRRRREIARLYKPLDDDLDESSFSDDEDASQPLYSSMYPPAPPSPHHHHIPPQRQQSSQSRQMTANSGSELVTGAPPPIPPLRVKNIWDDRLDVFEIGDSDDEGHSSPAKV